MNQKCYMLAKVGSFSTCKTYVRKYTDQSHLGGIYIGNERKDCYVLKSKRSSVKISDCSLTKIRKRKLKQKSSNKNCQITLNETTSQIGSSAIIKTGNIVKDIPQMKEFFEEVRRRDLMNYYQHMEAKERLVVRQRLLKQCPYCGLEIHSAENAYCKGPTEISCSYKERERELASY